MSIGHKRHLSKAAKRAAVLGSAALIGSLILVPSPGVADPDGKPDAAKTSLTLDEAKAKVDDLHHQAEVAAEQMNEIKVEMKAAHQRLRTFNADLKRQRSQVEALRGQIITSVLADYQSGGGLSSSTNLLVADDPQQFLTDMANSAVADNQQAGLLLELSAEQRQLGIQEEQAASEVDAIAADKAELAKQQASLDDKTEQAQEVLDGLEQEQLERLLEMQDHSVPPPTSRDINRFNTSDVPTSERAQVAVETALAQVGDPYVYGAAGPDAFDCSGLTMYAWAAAGVSIPHASSAQPGAGTPVSFSDLMPGDLIFYYSPISHVGMYIGNGMIVHAPHPGAYVEVVPMNLMPAVMAVRIG